MRRCCATLLLIGLVLQSAAAAEFRALDVYLDSSAPVAAWQFELTSHSGAMQVVGVEQGDSPAFDTAPYYDREAVRLGQADRVVVADYSLEDPAELPIGRVRIATLHVMLEDNASDGLKLRLTAVADENGRTIDASIELEDSSGGNDD